MVTHHVEEIPAHFTHALLACEGSVVAAGALDDTLSAANLSACFGLPLRLRRDDHRWSCRAA